MTDRARRRIRAVARHARSPQRPAFDGWVRLESSGWYLQVSDLACEPSAAALMADDAAWFFAVSDWSRRRPAVWRRAERHAWLIEEELLAAEAACLVAAATRLRTLRPARDAAI